MDEITELINRRFDRLKTRVSNAPTGGSTDDARQFLANIQAAICNFNLFLDEIDLWLRDGLADDN